MRNRRDKILLFGLFNVKWAKSHGGILRLLAGVNKDGTTVAETCLRTELESLAAGVPMEIPSKQGGTEEVIVECHLTGWLADLLGAHGLGPWPESFQARHACRDCWWHTGCWCSELPPESSELKSKRDHAQGCGREVNGGIKERSLQELLANLHKLRHTPFRTKVMLTDMQRDCGVSKLYCVLESVGNDMSTDAVADLQHLFLLGITRHEIFWMLENFTSIRDGRRLIAAAFTWEDLNVERKKVNATIPTGHKIPYLQRPNTENKVKAAVNMNMTAAEVMHFALNSVAMIDPIVAVV